jgi:hypothetical protein
VKPGYEIRYGYDTTPMRQYGKISKIKIRFGWDTLIKKYINKHKKPVIGSQHINVNINNIDD